jgi:hypothetical protein
MNILWLAQFILIYMVVFLESCGSCKGDITKATYICSFLCTVTIELIIYVSVVLGVFTYGH